MSAARRRSASPLAVTGSMLARSPYFREDPSTTRWQRLRTTAPSLIGVIVSHVIVLFDFSEEQHEAGAPLRVALIEAGIRRIRPVLITVGATVLALFPLALHGGPLWEALCYAQIGGLTLATAVTLFLVPVIYSVFVLDLKIVRWERRPASVG